MLYTTANLLPFLLTCTILELTPGPNMTYLTALSSIYGKKAGFSMVAGIASGLLIIGLVTTFGVTTLVMEHPTMYHSLHWAGVGYMLWLAWDNLRAAPIAPETDASFDLRYFQRGLITNILNPKAMVFFVAVLPTFLDPQNLTRIQPLILTIIYVAIATIIHCMLVILANRMHFFFNTPERIKASRYFFSSLLLGVALWLALPGLD